MKHAVPARRAALLALLMLPACTTFATVRPARVEPGLSFHAQGSLAAPPGDLPGWIWSFDCADNCNHAVPGFEAGLFHGVSDSTRAYYLGGGLIAPLTPFLEGYRQFSTEPRASGIGFRVGIPITGWGEYRVFYRRDVGAKVTANTHFVVATGNSPNGESGATFLALVQSVGFVEQGARVTGLPAFSIGITRTTRDRYDEREAAFGVLATASLGVVIHRRRND